MRLPNLSQYDFVIKDGVNVNKLPVHNEKKIIIPAIPHFLFFIKRKTRIMKAINDK